MISMIWSRVSSLGSYWTRTVLVSGLVLYESTPRTLISSRSMAWQRSLLRWMTGFLIRSRPGISCLISQFVTTEP